MDTDGFNVEPPDNMSDTERQAYIQGCKDMAEYIQHVGYRAQQLYEVQLVEAESEADNPCSKCGEEQIYDGTTGLRCPECEM